MNIKALLRIASLLLVLTLLTGCFISRTFAIYSTASTGSVNFAVNKWSFEINDALISDSVVNTFSFNLFGSSSTNIIAPGFSGNVPIKIENTSDVKAKYNIALSSNNADIPIEYSIDNSSFSRTLPTISGTLATGSTSNVTLYWRWSKNAYTSIDKTIQNSSQSVTITANATAQQS